MKTPYVGQRVKLIHLLHKGEYPGVIAENVYGLCRVKLDCQEAIVNSVLYYDSLPEEVHSQLWQICYPENNKE